MHKLSVDGLTPAELRALDAVQQIEALNELFGESTHLGDLKCQAIDGHADAKIRAINEPTPFHKSAVVDTRRTLDKIAVMIQARKQQISILQTLLRATPI